MACKTDKNDKLIATIKAKVEPTPELIELLKRYRDGLNMAIRWAVDWARAKGRLPTLSEIYRAVYQQLKAMGLPPRIASDCYREALAIVKSFIAKGARGRTPVVRSLHMWLHKTAYKVEGNHLYTIGGYKAKIIGIEERYEEGRWREAKLVYRDGDMYLYISVEIPRPTPVAPKGVIAVDINERYVYYGNAQWVKKVETPVEKAVRLWRQAEELKRKYSASRYTPWNRRKGILEKISQLYMKSKNVVEDWAKRTAKRIVEEARERQCAVAIEDLTGLVEAIRELPKEHRTKMMLLAYRRLLKWIKWQAEKRGVVVVEVDPRDTSTTCPKCGGKMEEVRHRHMKCTACGFEAGRDVVAVLNIEKRTRNMLDSPAFSPLVALTPLV